ncbi:MAG: hypothetical protein LBR17_02440 [Bacteroidales bacterium]|jgi:hypothetical protein|nr:hypothetical protein [Bacteroidales bacterium]
MIRIKEQKRLVALFFAVMFFDATGAFAQNSIQSEVKEIQSPTGQPYTQKIIFDTVSISFSQSGYTNNPYIFYRTKVGSPTATEVAHLVNPDFHVKDVKVLGNEMFFCGDFGGKGFIAREVTNSFFTNGTFKWDFIQNSMSIEKIEVFNNQSGLQIVGIGIDPNKQTFFLHYDEPAGNYDIYQSSDPKEVMEDLELNSQHILTVSYLPLQSGTVGVVIRRYDQNNISVATTIQRSFDFKTYNDTLSKFQAKTIWGDYLAVVGTAKDAGTAILAATFAVTINTMPILQADRIEGFNDANIKIRDLTYNDNSGDQTLLILASTTSNTYPNTTLDGVIK